MSNKIKIQWYLPKEPHTAADQAHNTIRRNIGDWERTHLHGLPQPYIAAPYVLEMSLDEDDSWTTVLLVTWKGKPWDQVL